MKQNNEKWVFDNDFSHWMQQTIVEYYTGNIVQYIRIVLLFKWTNKKNKKLLAKIQIAVNEKKSDFPAFSAHG